MRIATGLMLLLAAIGKLFQTDPAAGGVSGPESFAKLLTAQGIVPVSVTLPAAWTVILAESATGLWLLSHVRSRTAQSAALALFVVFSGYLMLVRLTLGEYRCGCFGALSNGTVLTALIRNVIVIGMLSIACIWRPSLSPASS
ncbi:MAG: hypothetical protein RBS39_12640 [Phycisphaerales bacterium]|nr:hypothetical protein [Phycisphaerales bacterium]